MTHSATWNVVSGSRRSVLCAPVDVCRVRACPSLACLCVGFARVGFAASGVCERISRFVSNSGSMVQCLTEHAILTLVVDYLDPLGAWSLFTASRSLLAELAQDSSELGAQLCALLATSPSACAFGAAPPRGVYGVYDGRCRPLRYVMANAAHAMLIRAAESRWLDQENLCRVKGKYSRSSSAVDAFGSGRDCRFYSSMSMVSGGLLLAYYDHFEDFNAFDLRSGAVVRVNVYEPGRHSGGRVTGDAGAQTQDLRGPLGLNARPALLALATALTRGFELCRASGVLRGPFRHARVHAGGPQPRRAGAPSAAATR